MIGGLLLRTRYSEKPRWPNILYNRSIYSSATAGLLQGNAQLNKNVPDLEYSIIQTVAPLGWFYDILYRAGETAHLTVTSPPHIQEPFTFSAQGRSSLMQDAAYAGHPQHKSNPVVEFTRFGHGNRQLCRLTNI